jgi:cytochrome c oxidase subunit 2
MRRRPRSAAVLPALDTDAQFSRLGRAGADRYFCSAYSGYQTGGDRVRIRRNIRWKSATALVALLIVRCAGAAGGPVHEVQITASRYAFDPVTIQVNAGEPVRIVIRSKDGAHGFSIPKLKIDVQVPKNGDPATVEFTAPPPGRYEIACSEFCGSGHGQMNAALLSVGPTQTNRTRR